MGRRFRRLGSIGWLLRDEFLTDRNPGQVHGTPAEPGPGTRTVYRDTASILRVSDGTLNSGNNAGTGSVDPCINWGGFARVSGRIMLVKYKTPSSPEASSGCFIGWYRSGTPAYFYSNDGVSSWFNGGRFFYSGTSRAGDISAGLDTYYWHALILRSPQGMFYLRKAAEQTWRLYWIEPTGTSDPLWPTKCAINTGRKEDIVDYIRVPTVLWTPQPLVADGFGGTWPVTDGAGLTGIEAGGAGRIWQTANPPTWTNSDGYAVNTPNLGPEQNSGNLVPGKWYKITACETDYFYTGCSVGDTFLATSATALNPNNKVRGFTTTELMQSIESGVTDFYTVVSSISITRRQSGIVFNLVDENNYEIVFLDRVDGKIKWFKVVDGTPTLVNATTVTYADAARLVVRKEGTTVFTNYNNQPVYQGSSASGLSSARQGVFSTGSGASEVKLDNYFLYPLDANQFLESLCGGD